MFFLIYLYSELSADQFEVWLSMILFSKSNKVFVAYSVPVSIIFIIEVNNARGELSDVSDRTISLVVAGLDTASESSIVAEIAQAARPRYHVSATRGPFYARQPYINPDLGAGSHATRFLSCGAVGNANKAKWLHALGMKPAAMMAMEELQAQPADATPSPYRTTR